MEDLEATKLPVTAQRDKPEAARPAWLALRQIRGVHGADGSLLIDGANMDRETPLNMA